MKKTIEIFGEIDLYHFKSVYAEIQTIMKENYLDDIFIIINSTGGECDKTYAIIDVLNLLPNKKIGVIIGNCYSYANILLLNCDKRYMTKNSRFMYHGVFSNIKDNQYDTESLDTICNENKYYTKKLYDILSNKTKLPKEKLKKIKTSSLCNYFTADECLKYGIVDEIISSISEIDLQTD